MLGGSDARKDKARRLMTKIVNNISAKLEMGSPMVNMYLLRNPDHYTNCDFAPFYWKNFVLEARHPWLPKDSESEGESEKVTLIKRKGMLIGLSPVLDYIYRPRELENMCLYNWVRQCTRTKVQVKKQKKSEQRHEDVIGNSAEESDDNNLSDKDSTDDGNNELCSEPESCTAKPNLCNPEVGGLFDFLPHHPLFGSHKTRCAPGHKALVPKFIGETLPGCDQGDREWYCMKMLALFQPWRSGLDLKVSEQSWDDTFVAHKFSSRQQEVMDYF